MDLISFACFCVIGSFLYTIFKYYKKFINNEYKKNKTDLTQKEIDYFENYLDSFLNERGITKESNE